MIVVCHLFVYSESLCILFHFVKAKHLHKIYLDLRCKILRVGLSFFCMIQYCKLIASDRFLVVLFRVDDIDALS